MEASLEGCGTNVNLLCMTHCDKRLEIAVSLGNKAAFCGYCRAIDLMSTAHTKCFVETPPMDENP